MNARFCFPLLVWGLLAGASLAQGVDIPVSVAETLLPGIGSIVLDPIDLDGDGANEVLARRPTDCDATACAWALMHEAEDGWATLTAGRSAVLDVVQAGAQPALFADGVLWAWDGDVLYPTSDRLEGSFDDASAEDLIFAYDLLGFSVDIPAGATPQGLSALADVDGDGFADLIVVITGAVWMIEGAYSPFVIVGSGGHLLASGYSMDAPRLYGGSGSVWSTIVSVTPSGLKVQPFSAGEF